MKQKWISIFVILALLFTQVSAVTAKEAEETTANEYLDMDILFKADFTKGLEPEVGTLSGNNISTKVEAGEPMMKADSTGGNAIFYAYAEAATRPAEATLISFDMEFSAKTTRGYMDIFQPGKDGKAPEMNQEKLSRGLYVVHNGLLSYFQSFMPPCGTYTSTVRAYDTNVKYHFDMWIDYVNMKVTYFVDGAELGNVPLGEDFEGVAGFRMTVESMNGGANYLFDRMLIVNFPERGGKVDLPDVAVIENFEQPVSINYRSEENNLGYIYMDKNVSFTGSFLNVKNNEKEVKAKFTITDDENQVLEVIESPIMKLAGQEEKKYTFDAAVERYGFHYLDTKLYDAKTDALISEKKFQFSVAHAPAEGVRNPKIGFTDHTSSGHGIDEMERKVKLFADAGVGELRGEMVMYTNPNLGGYSQKNVDNYLKFAQLCEENDIKINTILTYGKIPPTTDAEYKNWEKYIEEVVNRLRPIAGDREITYEVWNEFNAPGFNYRDYSPEAYVKLLEHTYPVVKRLDPNSKVAGLVISPTIKPNHPIDGQEWVEEVFKLGCGDYMDVVDIHPYTHALPEDISTVRGRLILDVLDILKKYGYEDMKIDTSEMGWTTPGVIDEMGQAAYIVRWDALYYDEMDVVDWYVSQEKQTTSAHENGFGFIRTWIQQPGAAPPYSAKPAFLSIANYNALMTGAVKEKKLEVQDENDYYMQFKLADGKRAMLVWNSTGAEKTTALKLDCNEVTLYDLYGNPTQLAPDEDGNFNFDISDIPVYVVGNFENAEVAETKFQKLTKSIDATEGDIAYLQFKSNSQKQIELELELPANLTETQRNDSQISFETGINAVENEKIHVKAVDKTTGACYYSYSVPVNYYDNVTYELKSSYFRNGHWHCVIELRNNKYSGDVSGTVVIKEPIELAATTKPIRFENLLPRSTKNIHVSVPGALAGARLEIVSDIILDNEITIKDTESSVYMTAVAQMRTPPKIDGKISYGEWNKSMPIRINKAEQVVEYPEWTGPEDLDAKIYFMWDADNLYLAAEVQDDIHCHNDSLRRAWAGDGIQFAVSKINNASAGRTEYGIALIEGEPKVDRYAYIGLNSGVLNEKDVEVYSGVEFEASRSGNITFYEAKFPWEQIYESKPDISKMDTIYISVLVNEDDGLGRKGWLEYNPGIGLSKNAAYNIPIKLIRN